MVWIVLVMKHLIAMDRWPPPFSLHPHFVHTLGSLSFRLDLSNKEKWCDPTYPRFALQLIRVLFWVSSSNFVLLSSEGGCLTGIHSRTRRRGWITNRTNNSDTETNNPGLIFFALIHTSAGPITDHQGPAGSSL